jgi:hypothetical protein
MGGRSGNPGPVPEYIAPDQSGMISGKSDVDGVCLLELVCRRDRQTQRSPPRHEFDGSHEALVEMDGVYQRVNNCRWAVQTLEVRGGQFATRLLVPSGAQGPCHVRVFVQGDNDFAMGAADVYVRQSQAPAVARITAEVDDETVQSKTGG